MNRTDAYRRALELSERLMSKKPIDINTPSDGVRSLAEAFIKNRLANASGVESAKGLAVSKLIEQIENTSSPSLLLRIIETLNNMTNTDMEILASGGKKGSDDSSILSLDTDQNQNTSSNNAAIDAPTIDKLLQAVDAIAEGMKDD